MASKFKKILLQYDYEFPPELVAQKPTHPRDAAGLLVYERASGKTRFDTFKNLTKYLPPRAVLVFNKTKVIPARLFGKKETGGKMEVFYLGIERGMVRALLDRKIAIGAKIFLDAKNYFTLMRREEKSWLLKPSFPISRMPAVLARYGKTPIPPYIKHSPLKESALRREYQAVFAKISGSVAAPTASLHFTKSLLKRLKRAGHDTQFVTLHVGLGTFAPLTAENLAKKKLHEEFYEFDAATKKFLEKAKKEGRPIIAVGTTVVRTLESGSGTKGRFSRSKGAADLFIREGYKFKFVDGLITNFHVPRSSLLLLVSALVGRKKLLGLYKKAIRRRFRFFSFGDGMLIT